VPPFQAGHPGFAFSGAVGAAKGAQARFGRVAAVSGSKNVIAFGPLNHVSLPYGNLSIFFSKTQVATKETGKVSMVAQRIDTHAAVQAFNGGAWRNSIDYLWIGPGRVDRISSSFPGHFGHVVWEKFPKFGKSPDKENARLVFHG
jgi:hypothetical protein